MFPVMLDIHHGVDYRKLCQTKLFMGSGKEKKVKFSTGSFFAKDFLWDVNAKHVLRA